MTRALRVVVRKGGFARRAALGTGIVAAMGLVTTLATAGDPVHVAAKVKPAPQAVRELGRRLFFDPAASRQGMRACADCHDPGHGYSDRGVTSRDDTSPTKRHSQTLVDGASNPTGHWDGEFQKIEDLVRSRLTLRISPSGVTSYGGDQQRQQQERFRDGVARIARGGGRRGELPQGPQSPGVSAVPNETDDDALVEALEMKESGVELAENQTVAVDVLPAIPLAGTEFMPVWAPKVDLAGFVNPKNADARPDAVSNLQSTRRYEEAFKAAFGTEEITLERIAVAMAAYCHSIESGISPFDEFKAGKADAISAAAQRGWELFRGKAGCAACHDVSAARPAFTDYAFHDTGISWKAAGKDAEKLLDKRAAGDLLPGVGDTGAFQRQHRNETIRTFKTPTLRDVARHGPFMHDGSLATLADVVKHYATPGVGDPNLDPKFPGFIAEGTDVEDLVAFLESLTSARRPGLARGAWPERAPTTRLRFVDASGAPLPALKVALLPAGDVLPGFQASDARVQVMTTESDGSLEFEPVRATHTRVRLAEGIAPTGGDLVPDTCRDAVMVVPVRGRATLVLSLPKGEDVPETLFASHTDAPTLPDRKPPVTTLRRLKVEADEDGVQHATYEAPFRTDVGDVALLQLSRPTFGLTSVRVFLDPVTVVLLTLP